MQFFTLLKKIFNVPIGILFLRIFGYNKPYRVAILKILTLIFKKYRPHYFSIIHDSFEAAKVLKYNNISFIEFGVAGGNGLLSLEKYSKKSKKRFNINYNIYGFDFGDNLGLPKTTEPKDMPFFFSSGLFKMDIDRLKRKLKISKLILGDIKNTLPSFRNEKNIGKIMAIFFDLDYYSSTKEALNIFNFDDTLFAPRVWCYFDDVHSPANDFNGVHAAINDFNILNYNKKFVRDYGSVMNYKFGPFYEEVYIMHNFSHSDYNTSSDKTVISTKL
jgi:hypothetical protein